jgi:pimeloyl-ACP methyl ester carboxylesterase
MRETFATTIAPTTNIFHADLWGRGYTETPLVPHDGRLLALQLLFAASSSPLPWCTETFSIVGFSLGGGITMDFAATFPHLVRSVALLAPAGLIRKLPDVYVNFRQAARDGKSDAELNGMLAGVLGVGEGEDSKDDVVANAAALVRWQYENHQVSVKL